MEGPPDEPLTTPVVLMVFNRPGPTARVLERVAAARPRRMTVVCDGPRAGVSGEADRVAEVRALIERQVDWPCELHRDYAEQNLGCGPRIASGLTAAFDRYDRAIVLEDDTLPDRSFFPFCEAMLDRYATTPEVMHVSGANAAVGLGLLAARDAYSFSRLPDIWGWATWSRAWRAYDYLLADWPAVRRTGWLASVAPHRADRRALRGAFDHHHRVAPNPNTWDTSWIYACARGGLSVTPGRNLVKNIGFGDSGTNCTTDADPLAGQVAEPIDAAQLAPPPMTPDRALEALLLRHRFGGEAVRRKRSLAGRLRLHKATDALKRMTTRTTGVGPSSG